MSVETKPHGRRQRGRLASYQFLTVALLFAGYASYYFCRADFSVAMPMLIDELHRHGMSSSVAVVRLGAVVSFGVLAYAVGKFLLGGLGDFWGGRRSFLIGLGGAVVFTIMFTMGGVLPIFSVAWIGNRLVQSMGLAWLVIVSWIWVSYTS
jgi:sugar phosphate permease